MARLHGKTALVTGAARGIGEAIAAAFAREGARVLLTDLREDEGRATADAIGDAATFRTLDVRDESDWSAAIDDALDRFGGLDIVVNNAGITGLGPDNLDNAPADTLHDPEHASLETWQAVLRTNLDGVFLGCKHAIRGMRRGRDGEDGADRGGGSIINIGSRSGVVGIPRAAAYAASKAGVRNHTKTVALYCTEEGLAIRCNAIQPAAVLTPMWDAVLGTGAARAANMKAMTADTPLRRFAAPGEVASLAVYLASDESSYCTGGEFNLDGGLLAGSAATPPREAAPAE